MKNIKTYQKFFRNLILLQFSTIIVSPFTLAQDLSSSQISLNLIKSEKIESQEDKNKEVLSPEDLSWRFRFKKNFWTKVIGVLSKSEITKVSAPQDQGPIEMISFKELRNGKVDLPNIFTPRVVPPREASALKAEVFKLVRWLGGTCLSVNKGEQEGPIPSDHNLIQGLLFNPQIENIFPKPIVPAELAERGSSILTADVFGAVAYASPFTCYLSKKNVEEAKKMIEKLQLNSPPEDLFEMDLLSLANYSPKPGFSSLGARVNLEYRPESGKYNTISIDYQGQELLPNNLNPLWIKAKKVAACGLATHNTLIKHLAEVHMLISGQMTGLVLKNFKKDHPLRQVMERHGTGAIAVNNYSIPNLVEGEFSSVPAFSNFDSKEVQKIMREHFASFDISTLDVVASGVKRGLLSADGTELAKDGLGQALKNPSTEMALKFWKLTQKYLHNVMDYVYQDDQELAQDPSVQQFFKDMEKYFQKGIGHYTRGKINKETLVNLLAIYIHSASFGHESVGNITKNYNALPQYFPSQVLENGCNPSVNVAFKYLMTNVLTDKENIQVPQGQSQPTIASLLDDASEIVTTDKKLQNIMKDWQKDLALYNDELTAKGLEPFVINPARCQDSVNQ